MGLPRECTKPVTSTYHNKANNERSSVQLRNHFSHNDRIFYGYILLLQNKFLSKYT
jgi:hypothetical protein